MNVYVIKSWHASDTPDANGSYVHIEGRTSGFISWIFNLIGISPTVDLRLNADWISFRSASWGGLVQSYTPLENVCTTLHGYIKPWKAALFIAIATGSFLSEVLNVMSHSAVMGFFGGLSGIIAGIIFYFLNKTLTVGFTDIGGQAFHIVFKRSIIEGNSVNEQAAADVCRLIQGRLRSLPASQRSNTPPPPPPVRGLSVPPPPPAASTNFYYADAQNQPKGPVDYNGLLALERAGEIKPDTKVIVEGGTAWSKWGEIKQKQTKP